MLDLVIRGGTVVTAGSSGVADVGVENGKITALGGGLRGKRMLAAEGKYVLPGGVDVHVHFSPYQRPAPGLEIQVDDFYSGSQAAIAGGITTIGNMTHQWPGETLHAALARDLQAAQRDAAVDYIMHPVLTYPTDEALAEIPELAREGHGTLKIFLIYDNFDANVDRYLEAVQIAGINGMLTLAHCEDGPVIRLIRRGLRSQGRTTPRYYPDSRPDYAEAIATERAIAFARVTGAPMYIVHLSSAAALDCCRRARAEGLPVYVETRPLYLYLTRERFGEPDGAKYTGNPPLRGPADVRAMWDGLASGDIQCLCTDHAPWTLRQKLDPSLDVTTLRAGVSDLETMMPMLFSEGVLTGRISLSRFVELTSTNAARLFGLFPRKGTVAVGSDADLIVWDPDLRRTVDGSTMRSRSGYSVYDGWSVQGWPICTVSRGETVFEQGTVVADRGRGQWLRREQTVAAHKLTR
jgi:dihydropyrimidinase